MNTKGLAESDGVAGCSSAARNGNIFESGAFITTAIFSGLQLRAEKICLQAKFTVTTRLVRAILHFSMRRMSRTLKLSWGKLKIVVISSGIGSCKSRMTLAPRALGTSALSTRMSGMLWTYTKSYRRAKERRAKMKDAIRMKLPYCQA